MKRIALAMLLVTAVTALVFLALNQPGAEASPDPTITVNSPNDANTRDSVLTLREAMMLATGDISLEDLTQWECGQVSGASWDHLSIPPHCDAKYQPGAASADTIVFGSTTFSPGTIALGDTLPALDTGDDTVDGSAAGVIVDGVSQVFRCFEITSDSNTIKGLEIRDCHEGVRISADAQNNTIGGSTQTERNVISGNRIGVFIGASSGAGNTVKGNYIGTNPAGNAAIPNIMGVSIFASGNTIGGTSEGERNVISGNTNSGVSITGGDGNTVKGNYIGTDAAGAAPLPNKNGVYMQADASNNTIGGTAAGEGNLIAFHEENGVVLHGAASTGNTIRGNSIHSNRGIFTDPDDDKGINNKDGGNTELAPPTITGFGSVTGTACPNCTIDIYSDEDDQGEVYEGSTTADGSGNWTFPGTPQGPNVTATATDTIGNTSEFSDPVAVPEATATPTATATATATPTPPDGATRTLVWSPGWHNVTWTGASTPAEASACADGDYAAAYRYVDGGLERYFPDRTDISNMGDLEQYAAFLILITDDVTCEMAVADPPDTERTLNWAAGWHNDGWTGLDGTDPEDAFACAEGSYAAAYRYVGGSFERHFPDRPEISNMGDLDQYDPFLILVTAPVTCTMPIAP